MSDSKVDIGNQTSQSQFWESPAFGQSFGDDINETATILQSQKDSIESAVIDISEEVEATKGASSKKYDDAITFRQSESMRKPPTSQIAKPDFKFLFDTISVNFDVAIFFKELFINSAWPIGMFFSSSWTMQSFWPSSIVAVVYNHCFPMMLWVTVISYVMMQEEASPQEFLHFEYSVWYPLLFYFIHRLQIAVKYASMSSREYSTFMSNTDLNVKAKYTQQLHLLSSWGDKRDPLVLDFEITSAALRVGCHIDRTFFVIPAPDTTALHSMQFIHWENLLQGPQDEAARTTAEEVLRKKDEEEVEQWSEAQLAQAVSGVDDDAHGGASVERGSDADEGNAPTHYKDLGIAVDKAFQKWPGHPSLLRIPLFVAMKGIMKYIDEEENISNALFHMARFSSLVMLAIPYFGFINYKRVGLALTSTWLTVYLTTSSILVYKFFFMCVQFIFISIQNVHRNYMAQKVLHSMIRLSDVYTSTPVEVRFSKKDDTNHVLQGKLALDIYERILDQQQQRYEDNESAKGQGQEMGRLSASHVLSGGDDEENEDLSALDDQPQLVTGPGGMRRRLSRSPSVYVSPTLRGHQPQGKEQHLLARMRATSQPPMFSFRWDGGGGGEGRGAVVAGGGGGGGWGNKPTGEDAKYTATGCGEHERERRGRESSHGVTLSRHRAHTISGPSEGGLGLGLASRDPGAHTSKVLPRISFRFEENVVAWSWARVMARNVGLRYTARMEIFTVCCLLANAGLMLAVLSLVFTETGQKRAFIFTLPIFRQAFVSITMFSIFLVFYTYAAANVNFELNDQRVTLCNHLFRVQERIVETRELFHNNRIDSQTLEKELKFWRGIEKTLLSCRETAEAHDKFRPYYVLWLKASYELSFSIATAIASFYIAILSAYLTTIGFTAPVAYGG